MDPPHRLTPACHSPRNAYTLLKVLADSFGKGYLETALDTYVAHAGTRSRVSG
jgi:hypothetical protein